MKSWLVLGALLLMGSAMGAPPCYPGEVTANDALPKIVVDNAGNCAAVWFCDGGHRWLRQYIIGSGDECDYGYSKAIAQLFMTHEDKDALWTSTFVVPGVAATDDASNALALSVPYPSIVPPSGLVTQDTKVYRMSTPTNAAPVFQLVGTIALGVACDAAQKFGSYYRVDRSLVKFPTGVIQPSITYAKCDL